MFFQILLDAILICILVWLFLRYFFPKVVKEDTAVDTNNILEIKQKEMEEATKKLKDSVEELKLSKVIKQAVSESSKVEEEVKGIDADIKSIKEGK